MKKGFTIVEFLIYIGLLSMFLVILTNLFVTSLEISTKAQTETHVSMDAKFIISRLTYDIKRADSITTPVNIGDTSNSLSLVINSVTYNYSLSGTNLMRDLDQVNSIDTKVNSISFKKLGNNVNNQSILINFDLNGKNYSTTVKKK